MWLGIYVLGEFVDVAGDTSVYCCMSLWMKLEMPVLCEFVDVAGYTSVV